mgnify:CR=1 FL=1|jgi:predicted anti-sigma-YlaC factor YlaD
MAAEPRYLGFLAFSVFLLTPATIMGVRLGNREVIIIMIVGLAAILTAFWAFYPNFYLKAFIFDLHLLLASIITLPHLDF